MTEQDDIWRDQQREWSRQDRVVWCSQCDGEVRDKTSWERSHPEVLEDEYCESCTEKQKEDAECEVEWAWDEAWVALYEAALREDEYRRMV